jgi:hypothetical protein
VALSQPWNAVPVSVLSPMALDVDIFLLQQSTGRWILRSIVLGSDREFEQARAALEAAVQTAQQTAGEGRTANVILKEWRKKARRIATYNAETPSIAVEAPVDERQKT